MVSRVRTSASIAFLTSATWTLPFSFSSTLDVSMVQNSVSVKVEGVVFDEESVRIPLGWLDGGVRATSAYDALALGWDEVVNTGLRARPDRCSATAPTKAGGLDHVGHLQVKEACTPPPGF
jgi:hypothetical protein